MSCSTHERWATEQDDISKEQVRFYKELYSKGPTEKVAQDRLLNLLDRKLTDEQRDSCKGQLTVGECLGGSKVYGIWQNTGFGRSTIGTSLKKTMLKCKIIVFQLN